MSLSVETFFQLYESEPTGFGWVDVRSEGEFEKGALPRFVNLPILTNSERHQVGLTYKQKGQSEAVKVGHTLVDPHRPERVEAWKRQFENSPSRKGIMICWRGGMRSKIAATWAREAEAQVETVEGGIKAIRTELLKTFTAFPKSLILSGLTGSGKTELLKDTSYPKIDLEELANHRGSSFGRKIGNPQPSQATFENRLALEFRRVARHPLPILLEDESQSIGSCFLPRDLKLQMNPSPCVWVDSSAEERAARIFEEYIQEPLKQGIPAQAISEWMIASLQRIEKKLGGLETSKTRRLIEEAFRKSGELGFRAKDHEEWITRLLTLYYDPMYQYGFDKHVENGRKILFRGTIQECRQWLNSRKP